MFKKKITTLTQSEKAEMMEMFTCRHRGNSPKIKKGLNSQVNKKVRTGLFSKMIPLMQKTHLLILQIPILKLPLGVSDKDRPKTIPKKMIQSMPKTQILRRRTILNRTKVTVTTPQMKIQS